MSAAKGWQLRRIGHRTLLTLDFMGRRCGIGLDLTVTFYSGPCFMLGFQIGPVIGTFQWLLWRFDPKGETQQP
jgi:hypothetical protein